MKSGRLDDMVRGWFVGAFSPTLLSTQDCEVAIQRFSKGDHEKKHLHKIATEITAIVVGRVRMSGQEWESGDIIVIEPGEATDFEALTDAITVVVKHPGALNDKYIVE